MRGYAIFIPTYERPAIEEKLGVTFAHMSEGRETAISTVFTPSLGVAMAVLDVANDVAVREVGEDGAYINRAAQGME